MGRRRNEKTKDEEFLGPYRLGPQIGCGGMASVRAAYLDNGSHFTRPVAVKQIHPCFAADPAFVTMFMDEARIASLISHPNVIEVTDYGECDGQPFMALELLVGESLSRVQRVLSDHPEHFNETQHPLLVSRIIADLCEGLHAAHEVKDSAGAYLNIIHRDISPSNLLVVYDGTPKLLDFGIAKARNRHHHTTKQVFKGKLAYSAPEVFSGQAYDRRADIWSLGVVLWEMLVGEDLFDGDTDVARIKAVTTAVIPEPSSRRPSLPKELDAIVMRALARDPEQRFATAREMSDALESFLGGRNQSMPTATVARWLDSLFPGAKEEKMRMYRCGPEAAAPSMMTPVPLLDGIGTDVNPDILDAGTDHGARTPGGSAEDTIRREAPELQLERARRGREVSELAPTLVDPAVVGPILLTRRARPKGLLARARAGRLLDRADTRIALAGVAFLCIAGAYLHTRSGMASSTPRISAPVVAIAAAPVVAAAPAAPIAPTVPAPAKIEAPIAPATLTSVEPPSAAPPLEVNIAAQRPDPAARQARRAVARPRKPAAPTLASATPAAREARDDAGEVYIQSPNGAAEVIYGGKVMGTTPAVLSLPAGQRAVQLRRKGETDLTEILLNVKPGETVLYTARLDRTIAQPR